MYPVSDHFNGSIFLNPVSTGVMQKGAFFRVLKKYFQKHPDREPAVAPGPFTTDIALLQQVPTDMLRITWLGHSTTLIEIDGKRFLTDPVWSRRASPFTRLGPKRFFNNPVELDDLPSIDFILLSHNHYDHLDKKTIIRLTSKGIPVITMLGVGNHLRNWGIHKDQITELDWWQTIEAGNQCSITAAPARHFSGRWLNDRFKTLWGSFAIRGSVHNVYFGADSGYYEGFKTIGERLGPFDLTMLDIGAYNEEWEAIHMGPEKAVQAFVDVKGGMLMPIHWGTFSLAFHPWTEPIEQLIKEASKRQVPLFIPAPGETCTVDAEAYNSEWWIKYK
ncbi:MAG: MBL fold metallo-hydrolase [Flavisolibacter sp.]|nr:MBL fold metallo-hydrolase [Flavisolibacter sp.]